jgi:hypothetical protein
MQFPVRDLQSKITNSGDDVSKVHAPPARRSPLGRAADDEKAYRVVATA